MSVACWEQHILRRHGELTDHIGSIRTGIEEPDIVFHDARFPNRESYYVWGIIEEYEGYYLKISVEFYDGRYQPSGTVITAYISRNIKPGETLKWRRTR